MADLNRLDPEEQSRIEEIVISSIRASELDMEMWETVTYFLEAKRKVDERTLELWQLRLRQLETGFIPGSKESREAIKAQEAADGEKMYAKHSFADAAVAVLEEAGAPVHAKVIWERMENGGVKSQAKSPVHSLVSVMHNEPRIHFHGKNFFGLEKWESKKDE